MGSEMCIRDSIYSTLSYALSGLERNLQTSATKYNQLRKRNHYNYNKHQPHHVPGPTLKTIEIQVPESISERDVKLATAVMAFQKRIISLNRAAEIAEMPLQELLIELKNRNIPAYHYTDEARQELEV